MRQRPASSVPALVRWALVLLLAEPARVCRHAAAADGHTPRHSGAAFGPVLRASSLGDPIALAQMA